MILAISLCEGLIYELGDIDYIIHMAAETHVDRSIDGPNNFIDTNNSYNLVKDKLVHQKKINPKKVWSEVKTVIVIGLNYAPRFNPLLKNELKEVVADLNNSDLDPIVNQAVFI